MHRSRAALAIALIAIAGVSVFLLLTDFEVVGGSGGIAKPSPTVFGGVVDQSGKPCEYAQVEVAWRGALGGSEGMHLVSDADGRFAFYGVPGRTYEITVVKVGLERRPTVLAQPVKHEGVSVDAPAAGVELVVVRN